MYLFSKLHRSAHKLPFGSTSNSNSDSVGRVGSASDGDIVSDGIVVSEDAGSASVGSVAPDSAGGSVSIVASTILSDIVSPVVTCVFVRSSLLPLTSSARTGSEESVLTIMATAKKSLSVLYLLTWIFLLLCIVNPQRRVLRHLYLG